MKLGKITLVMGALTVKGLLVVTTLAVSTGATYSAPLQVIVYPADVHFACNANPGTVVASIITSGGNGATITLSLTGNTPDFVLSGNNIVVVNGGMASGDCTTFPSYSIGITASQ